MRKIIILLSLALFCLVVAAEPVFLKSVVIADKSNTTVRVIYVKDGLVYNVSSTSSVSNQIPDIDAKIAQLKLQAGLK
jgi:hypothetical protein